MKINAVEHTRISLRNKVSSNGDELAPLFLAIDQSFQLSREKREKFSFAKEEENSPKFGEDKGIKTSLGLSTFEKCVIS